MSHLSTPWCSRKDAAHYLNICTDTLDKRLVSKREPGKIRYRISGLAARRKILVWAKDVIACAPTPEDE